jgi:murein DD-endopeptidase MepM/ murein hydrolase activator NlpD
MNHAFASSGLPPGQADFSERLIRCNGLERVGFERWIFYPGMLFKAEDLWWAEGRRRRSPHEGLDICIYADSEGQHRSLDKSTKVPLTYEGEIVKIDDDFLGKSIYVSHSIYDTAGNQLHTIYGHTSLCDEVRRGEAFTKGDVIATIAGGGNRKASIPPHLHISIAWIPKSIRYERLNWETISAAGNAILLDPLQIMDCKYTVVKQA